MLLFITFHISSNNKLIICFVDKCVWNIDYRSINRVSMRGNLAKSSKKSTSFDSAVLLHRIYPIDIEWICSDMYEDVYISIVQNTKKSRYGRKHSSVRDFLNNLFFYLLPFPWLCILLPPPPWNDSNGKPCPVLGR